MTNTEIIQAIKAEIERRKKENMYVDLPMSIGRYYEDRDLLAFIDSLEPVTDCHTLEEPEKPIEGLEEEIQSFWNRASGFQPKFATLEVKENGFAVIARHFAQWGAEHLKK